MSDVGCGSDALNVNIVVVGEIPRHPEPGSADVREVHVIHVMMTSCQMTCHQISIAKSALS